MDYCSSCQLLVWSWQEKKTVGGNTYHEWCAPPSASSLETCITAERKLTYKPPVSTPPTTATPQKPVVVQAPVSELVSHSKRKGRKGWRERHIEEVQRL